MSSGDVAEAWADERPRLLGLAYRITGSRTESEDLIQEAYARLAVANDIADPPAWLTTVTARLAVDHLRLARVQRESYVGPWVPEPLDDRADDPGADAIMAESVSTALLVVMETMSPVERAAFVLHDVFGYAHDEVAAMLDRTPAAIRQAARRGREHVQAGRPRFNPDPERRRLAGERFVAAAAGADLSMLMDVLSPDVIFRSDGGGVVSASRKVLHGRERVVKFLAALAGTNPGFTLRMGWRNAGPAVAIMNPTGATTGLMLLQVGETGQIVEINSVLNPQKLTGEG